MTAFAGLVGRSYVAQSPNADCERTINLFLEHVESGKGKNDYVFYRSPGLLTAFSAGGGQPPVRGLFALNGHLFAVIGGNVYDLTAGYAISAQYGPIPDDNSLVSMAANPTQLALVSFNQAYVIGSGALTPLTWFGGDVVDVGVINLFFVFLAAEGDGFYFSEPGDATLGSPLNFISAEASANKYVALKVSREEIWLFGSQISQVFYDNSANDPTNPFLPNLSAVIPYGTIAKKSPVVAGARMAWLARSQEGLGIAVATDGGYIASRISNHAFEYALSQYAKIQAIEDAESYTLLIKGHLLWRIYFPTANATWEYDFSVNDWREIGYWNGIRGQYEAHLGRCAAAEFGTVHVGSRKAGLIYQTSMDLYSDAGAPIRWLRRSPILSNENKRVSYPWFELDMWTGQGDGSNLDPTLGPVTPEADPQVMMRFSDDWGQTWSNERQRSAGRQGEYAKRVIWRRNGAARQRVFEISGTYSRPMAINNAYLRDPMMRST